MGKAARARRIAAHVASIDARNAASAEQVQRLERPAFDREPVSSVVQIGGRLQADVILRQEPHGFRGRGERARHRRRVGQRLQTRERARPGGVCAKRRTASTIRSNSRALRAPGCIGVVS